ncbi:MAG: hypothetical protein A2029_06465 [Chloroflexi bacterium RBG_19FT_COMBO_47_9]|nr:MAG: hypothetical protein A2029_06465 [Chloroflexi bacterium RBG_19FT_COMBO_47_9]
MQTNEVLQSIITLFSEAYAGPPDPSSTWFIDNEPDSGILGIIGGVSTSEAAWSSKNNEPGTTIAAHVEHLHWSLANANAALQGKPYNSNWKESWNTLDTDELKWAQLKQDLKTEFEALRLNLQKQTELSGKTMPGVMALVPHAAYHLGTIRQLIERARENLKVIS